MAANDLTDLANVKAYLRIKTEDTTSDALLALLITAASDYIQNILNRTFKAADYVQRSNGNNADIMVASNYPIISVSGVIVDGVTIPAAPSEAAPGYLFDKDAIYLRGFKFTKGVKNVVLSYNAGYSATPPVVADCCATLVGKKFKYLDRIGHLSKILAGETVTYERSDLTDELKSVLRNFAKVVPI
ncbi:conserved hypothetical protein [Gammaproteobacteria bacterium]